MFDSFFYIDCVDSCLTSHQILVAVLIFVAKDFLFLTWKKLFLSSKLSSRFSVLLFHQEVVVRGDQEVKGCGFCVNFSNHNR